MLSAWAAPASAISVTVLPGSTPQAAPTNTPFPTPIRLLYTDDGGNPLAATRVSVPFVSPNFFWFSGSGHSCGLDLGPCTATTDQQGMVVLSATAGGTPGERTVWFGSTPVRLTVLSPGQVAPVAPLWWGGPSQSGWGVAIPQRGQSVFPVYFAYDASGRATWSVLEGDWSSGFASTFRGTLNEYRGAPYYAFDTTKVHVAQSSPGSLQVDPYRGVAELTVQPDSTLVTPPPLPVQLGLAPLDFSPASEQTQRGVSDIWWGGPSQSGWGITIGEDHGNLFLAWFTYDGDGKPTWFSMSDGAWRSTDTWTGPIYRTTGSSGLGAAYDPKAFRATTVGTFSIRFIDANTATFAFSLEGHTGTLQLQRFDY